MSQQFWVKNSTDVRGPFSVADLRTFAADGRLLPGHLLSPDRKRWQPAGKIRGLTFRSGSNVPTFPEPPPTENSSADTVRLRLDPDDLARSEESFAEAFEREFRRGRWPVLASFLLHLALLVGLALWRIHSQAEDEFVYTGGWITPKEQTEVVPTPPPRKAMELQAFDFNAAATKPANDTPPLTKPAPEAKAGPPAQPVDVKRLLEHRSEEGRRQMLAQVDDSQRIETAVNNGLRWLERQQLPEGNWQLHNGYPDASEAVLKTDTGATALALLAYLGHGQTHLTAKDEPTRLAVEKGLKWLIRVQKPNGDFHDWDELGRQTAYYAHSLAVIALCEAYALTHDRSLMEPARRGIQFLLDSQQPEQGGWKYQPQDAQSVGDLSVTGWALMALHTARAAGLTVPQEPFQRGATFLDLVQSEDGSRYQYEPRPGWEPTPAMTATGLLCRQYLGWSNEEAALQKGVDYLLGPANEPVWTAGKRNVYSWYYTAQVLHNLKDARFADFYRRTAAEILDQQATAGSRETRGSWHPSKPPGAAYEYGTKAGRLYVTVMCLLILETPYRHRPVSP